MSAVAERLAQAGYELPDPPSALGAYVPAVRSGDLVFTSGQLPLRDGVLVATGHVDGDVAVDVAKECARRAVVNAIAAASGVCELDDVVRVVRLTGYVASSPGFNAQPAVLDAASDLLRQAFGEASPHSRVAIGVAELPLSAPLELDLVLRVGG